MPVTVIDTVRGEDGVYRPAPPASDVAARIRDALGAVEDAVEAVQQIRASIDAMRARIRELGVRHGSR